MQHAVADVPFPLPLADYPAARPDILATLADRIHQEPFNAVATGIFALAILHTFAASRISAWAHELQRRHDARLRAEGQLPVPSVAAEAMHFVGEVEVVFGLWAVVLLVAITFAKGWDQAKDYLDNTVNFTEPLFVVVIMALASTRPIISVAENAMRRVAALGGRTPAAWWVVILSFGPVLGSLVTEPAAMTISALLLARQFYDLEPSTRLKYATLGLLFVNISIGGTLTHFAAPPVLMVARPWGWDTPFMLGHFGWRSLAGDRSVQPDLLPRVSHGVLGAGDASAESRHRGPRSGKRGQRHRATFAGALVADRGSHAVHGVDRHERPLPSAPRQRLPDSFSVWSAPRPSTRAGST